MLMKKSRTARNHWVILYVSDSAGNSVPSGIYVFRMGVRLKDGRWFEQSVKMGLVR